MNETREEDLFNRYMNTYNGRNLKYSLYQEGIWKVLGEDVNCDLGGSHHQPELGTFEGKLIDIIKYAVTLNGFWAWGGGGNFVKVKPPVKIDTKKIDEINELKEELKNLNKQIKEINKRLESI